MAENEKEQQLDALIDSLLSSYAAAEPRPGFELRIHARLRAQLRRQLWTWNLSLAGAVAAAIVTVLLVVPRAELHDHDHGTPVQALQTKGSESEYVAVAPVVTKRIRPAAVPRHMRPQSKTTALLQLASAAHSDALIFEREKSYVAPALKQEESVDSPQTPADKISIQNLGVDSIAVKGLALEKGDQKGNL